MRPSILLISLLLICTNMVWAQPPALNDDITYDDELEAFAPPPQSLQALQAGEKLRIKARYDRQLIVGTLISMHVDKLTVLRSTPRGDRILNIPLMNILTVEVSRGYETKPLAGALIGAPVGAATFASVRYAIDQDRHDALIGGVIGLAAGGIVGHIIGATPHERWLPVPLRRTIALAPAEGTGIGVTVALW